MGSRRRHAVLTARLAACLGVAAAVVVPLDGAAAEEVRHRDAPRDVVSVLWDYGPNLEHRARVVPARRKGDVTSLRAAHRDDRVVVAATFRAVRRTTVMVNIVRLRTGAGSSDVRVESDGHRIREVVLQTRGGSADCPGLRAGVDVVADRLRVAVPRDCLGRAGWVRAGMETITGNGAVCSRSDICWDDALRRGRDDDDWPNDPPALGPRLRRG